MTNIYLEQFPAKTTPVGSDIFYIGDSANSFVEAKTTLTQVITNNKIITEPEAISAGNIALGNTGNTIVDSGITVDHAQNVTGTNTLTLSGSIVDAEQAATKEYADTKLAIANNLSDVNNRNTSFNNIAPATPENGDMMYFNGTNWIRFPFVADEYIIQGIGGVPTWQPFQALAGFVDNAIFASENGLTITSSSLKVPLDTIQSATAGSLWTTNGDGTGMKCGRAGTYLFTAVIPVMHVGAAAGYTYFTFYNGATPISPNVPYFLTGVATILPATFNVFITCAVNDVISLQAILGNTAPANSYSVASASTTGADYAAAVTIARLT